MAQNSYKDADAAWVDEVREFIRVHYAVRHVKCPHICYLFNGHSKAYALKEGGDDADDDLFYIFYQSIRNTFSRKKDPRPPTNNMVASFSRIKELQLAGKLVPIPGMPLRNRITI